MIVTFSVLRPFTDEATSWAMPRTAPGSSVSAELPSMTAAVAGVASSANRSSSGSTSCTCGELTPWTLADRAGDLALERALVGDLLLEVGGAELLLVEQLEALAATGVEADALSRRARRAPARPGVFSTASAVPLLRSS